MMDAAPSASKSLMLNCQLVDDAKNFFGAIFPVEIPSAFSVGQLKKVVKAENAQRLNHLDANELILWKLTDPLPPGLQIAEIIRKIKAIEFPDPESDDELDRDGTVQVLHPLRGLSEYWENLPKPRHLHLIVQIPHSSAHILVPVPPGEGTDGLKRKRDEAAIDDVPAYLVRMWEQTWLEADRDNVPFCVCTRVERDGTLSDDNIPDRVTIPEYCWIMRPPRDIEEGVDSRVSGFLFRDEYIEALKGLFKAAEFEFSQINDLSLHERFSNPFLDDAVYADACKPRDYPSAFIITGQPGIGKSLLLSILLILRLHANLPTFYQVQPEMIHYFTKEGVRNIALSSTNAILTAAKSTPNAWVLVDSGVNLQNVHEIFFTRTSLFIVQTTSPRDRRMKWVNKMSSPSTTFILKPWMLSELLCGRSLQKASSPTEGNLFSFFTKYGASARLAYVNAGGKEKTYGHALSKDCSSLTLDELRTLLIDYARLNFKHDLSYKLITLVPGLNRDEPVLQFPSQHICDMLVETLNKKTGDAGRQLYRYFDSTTYTSPVAGAIFESIVHSVFTETGKTLAIHELSKSASPGSANWHWKTSSGSKEYYLHIHSEGFSINNKNDKRSRGRLPRHSFSSDIKSLSMTGYYRPDGKTQATFDGILFDAKAKHAVLIQMTIAESHDVNVKGVRQLEKLGVVKFSYIVVTPPEKQIDLAFPLEIEQKFQSVYQLVHNV